MNIKILGAGCSVCQSMYNTVTQIVAREHIEADVEYVTDIDEILSYGVLSTPALLINDRVVMQGFRGTKKIQQALHEAHQS